MKWRQAFSVQWKQKFVCYCVKVVGNMQVWKIYNCVVYVWNGFGDGKRVVVCAMHFIELTLSGKYINLLMKVRKPEKLVVKA